MRFFKSVCSLFLPATMMLVLGCSDRNDPVYLDNYSEVNRICDSALVLADPLTGGKILDYVFIVDERGTDGRLKSSVDSLIAGRKLLNTTLQRIENDSLRLLVLSTKMKSYFQNLCSDPEDIDTIVCSIQEYLALAASITDFRFNRLSRNEHSRIVSRFNAEYLLQKRRKDLCELNPDSCTLATKREVEQAIAKIKSKNK